MIDFKKNFEKTLPYDRRQYIEFLSGDVNPSIKWYGVSFQLPGGDEGKEIDLIRFVEIFESLFQNVISKFDAGSYWIVNHDDKDLNWFPYDDDNLIHLRALFKDRNVPNTFKGALVFQKNDLLKYARDLILYPYAVLHKDGFLYKDLNISHGELQFIIKISGHLNVDFLSTNQDMLRELLIENSSSLFVIKEYRGTSLY